jgi:hypothetical protein
LYYDNVHLSFLLVIFFHSQRHLSSSVTFHQDRRNTHQQNRTIWKCQFSCFLNFLLILLRNSRATHSFELDILIAQRARQNWNKPAKCETIAVTFNFHYSTTLQLFCFALFFLLIFLQNFQRALDRFFSSLRLLAACYSSWTWSHVTNARSRLQMQHAKTIAFCCQRKRSMKQQMANRISGNCCRYALVINCRSLYHIFSRSLFLQSSTIFLHEDLSFPASTRLPCHNIQSSIRVSISDDAAFAVFVIDDPLKSRNSSIIGLISSRCWLPLEILSSATKLRYEQNNLLHDLATFCLCYGSGGLMSPHIGR